MPLIRVFASQPDLVDDARVLAEKLGLAFTETKDISCDYFLLVTPEFIGVQASGDHHAPFYIDFLSSALRYRQKNISVRNENLARALGLKNHRPNRIIDATAGLGRDSFIIASLDIPVTMIERSPIIQVLLNDAMVRAATDPDVQATIQRMQLQQGNAIELITSLPRADVIYLDPMFPQRNKSALVKKDMRIFHELIGHDLDADQLLKVALTCADKRVVVKRPKLAAHLANLAPHYSLKGNSSRFDIYLT